MRKNQQGAVTTMQFDVKAGFEQWYLFMADNHHDSVFCNRELETEHLEEAKKRRARIFIFGDLFDAMQGRFDPRRSMDELRPEYRREDYYDFVVQDVAAYLKPYAHLIDVIADGNHELAVLKNANTNLADRLCCVLNSMGKNINIMHGGYGGWIRLMHQNDTGVPQGSIKVKYFHGAGGEAPVTRGVIQTNRQAVYLPDADIVVNGHSHNSYYVPISRERISGKGTLFSDIQHHIRVPGYKQAYGDGSKGWDVTRGGVPKPIGCCWVKITYRTAHAGYFATVQVIPDVRGASMEPGPDGLFDGKVYDDDREGY